MYVESRVDFGFNQLTVTCIQPNPPAPAWKWNRPKMAACVFKRCVTAAVKVKRLSPSILGRYILQLDTIALTFYLRLTK